MENHVETFVEGATSAVRKEGRKEGKQSSPIYEFPNQSDRVQVVRQQNGLTRKRGQIAAKFVIYIAVAI